jgi:hypothetical protein
MPATACSVHNSMFQFQCKIATARIAGQHWPGMGNRHAGSHNLTPGTPDIPLSSASLWRFLAIRLHMT